MKEIVISDIKGFIETETAKGALFILEPNLLKCPNDWIECIIFIINLGLEDHPQFGHCLVMDEEVSEKVFKTVEKEDVDLFILSRQEPMNRVWQVMLTKEKINGAADYTKLFIGGESLRSFCDKHNIYYCTKYTSDKQLLSGTNLMWLKDKDEDCRAVG